MSLSRYGANFDERWLLAGQPSGTRDQNMDQLSLTADCAALVTQVMTSVLVPVQGGELITNVSFMSGGTAAGTPTNWWFALYSSAATPALLAQSADQTTAAWAADTVKTLALATPQRIGSSAGFVYAAVMVKATVVPTLAGKLLARAAGAGVVLGSSVFAQTSGAALVAAAPATIATPTTVATVPFCALT